MHRPDIHQDPLPGMPPAFAPLRLYSRNALARALTPEYVGISPEDYRDITPEIEALALPSRLQESLIGVPPKSEGAVPYHAATQPHDRSLLWIALSPSEYKVLSGSIITLGQRAVGQSQERRERRGQLSDVDLATARRAGVHAVESKLVSMHRYLGNELTPKLELIEQFQEAAKYPGLARFGSEAAMRQKLSYLQEFIFGDMFAALRVQRRWSSSQEQLARRTVTKLTILDREQNMHLGVFRNYLSLLHEWNGHKKALTSDKIWQAQTYIREKQSDERTSQGVT